MSGQIRKLLSAFMEGERPARQANGVDLHEFEASVLGSETCARRSRPMESECVAWQEERPAKVELVLHHTAKRSDSRRGCAPARATGGATSGS